MEILPKRFFLARHAETADNENGIISGGGSDPDLTEHGRAECKGLREAISLLETPPSPVIVTSLKRTQQTAELMMGHANYIIEPDLKERILGEGDGVTTEEQRKARPLGELAEGEETKQQHAARVIPALNRHLADAEENAPIFVTHVGTIRRIFESMGMPELHEIPPAALYECVNVNGKWKVFELFAGQDQHKQPKLIREDITPQRENGIEI